jgi:hypothetical protein
MKLNEVTQPSEKALFEALDAHNDTGLHTEDVVSIIKSVDGPWHGPMTGDEFHEHLQEMAKKYGGTL